MPSKKRHKDKLSKEQRSVLMSKVRGKNTKPEIVVRKLIHALGYRFRLHRKDLPGSPDIVFGRRKKVIFVHGCFWHRHEGCKLSSTPNTRKQFWQKKFKSNIERDARNIRLLEDSGWVVLVIWQCEVKNAKSLKNAIIGFLGED